jgi:nucleolar protein 12
LPKTNPVAAPVASSSKQVAVEGEKEGSFKRNKRARRALEDSEDEEEIEQPSAPSAGPSTTAVVEEEEEEENDAELSEIDTDEELIHEAADTTSKRKRKLATKLPKYTPADESSQDKDRRSIFVGNLPMEVTKSKASLRTPSNCTKLTSSPLRTS